MYVYKSDFRWMALGDRQALSRHPPERPLQRSSLQLMRTMTRCRKADTSPSCFHRVCEKSWFGWDSSTEQAKCWRPCKNLTTTGCTWEKSMTSLQDATKLLIFSSIIWIWSSEYFCVNFRLLFLIIYFLAAIDSKSAGRESFQPRISDFASFLGPERTGCAWDNVALRLLRWCENNEG